MGASSVTGTGIGSSNKRTVEQLAILSNGPEILITGIIACRAIDDSPPSSPPLGNSLVSFPKPFVGSGENYVVLLTPISGSYAYVVDKNDNEDGNFESFSLVSDVDCDVMYMVAKIGIRP